MKERIIIDENDLTQERTNNWRHFGRFYLIIVIAKLVLFTIGIFLENDTYQMRLLFLATLIIFGFTASYMIKTYKRKTKLKFIEKLVGLLGLFIVYSIVGTIVHYCYYTIIIGENPTTSQVFEKIQEIVKYDLMYLILTLPVIGFTKSKVI